MDQEAVLQWFCSNIDFHVTKVLKQHWYKSKYSYLDNPRPDFGLLLLVSGKISFVTEHGVVSACAGNLVFCPSILAMRLFFRTKLMTISFALMLTRKVFCHAHR